MSFAVRTEANLMLGDLYLNFLKDRRDELYVLIDEHREALNYEDGELRLSIIESIKQVGEAISQAKITLAPYTVVNTLLEIMQGLQDARQENRERVKELAFQQSVNKAALAEVSREISRVEDYFMFNLQTVAGPFDAVEFVDDFGPFNEI